MEVHTNSKYAVIGQSEPAPITAPIGHSVHMNGWMILLSFIYLFTLL
jgi:hypothetical protein